MFAKFKIKHLTFLIPIVFTISSCERSIRKGNEFYFKYYSIPTKIKYEDCFKWNSGYLCLAKNNDLIYYDKDLNIAKLVLDSSKNISYDYLYEVKDSLIAVKYDSSDITKYYFLDNSFTWNLLKNSRPDIFYEDETFIAYKCCQGEWGGTIFFDDKNNNRTYSAPVTCPIAINKIDNEYILTGSNGHLSGHTEILKIEDPKKLYYLKSDNDNTNCSWYFQYMDSQAPDYGLTKCKTGSKQLIDTFAVNTMATFLKEKNVYTLSMLNDKVFIGRVDSEQLTEVDSVDYDLWIHTGNSKTKMDKDGFITFFQAEALYHYQDRTVGFISLERDTIKVVKFKYPGRK